MDAPDHTAPEHRPNGEEPRRYTVAEAAELLGITAEAVRTRIKRGKLEAVKDPPDRTGTVYVLLRPDQTGPNVDPTPQGQDQTSDQTRRDDQIDDLRERVRFLEGELERRGQEATRYQEIVARLTLANSQLSARIPELEAPPDRGENALGFRESHGPSDDTPTSGSGGPESGVQGRTRWLYIVAAMVVLVLLILAMAGNAFISQPGGVFGG